VALDPSDIEAIGRAVAAAYGPWALAGVLLAIVAGVVIALKITAPEARRLTIAEIKDPNGELAKIRAAERAEMLAAMDDKLKALKFPDPPDLAGAEARIVGAFPKLPDYGGQMRAMHGQINARLTQEMAAVKALIPPPIVIPPFPVIPDFSAIEAQLAESAKSIESVGVAFDWVKGQVGDEHLLILMKKAISDHQSTAAASAAQVPGGALAAQEQSIAARLANDPDEGRTYQAAMRWLDVLESNPKISGIRVQTVKGWRKEVKAKFADGGALSELLTNFGFQEGALAQLLPAAAGGSGGSRSGAIPIY